FLPTRSGGFGHRPGYTPDPGGRVCGSSYPGGGAVLEASLGTTAAACGAREQGEDRRRRRRACACASPDRDVVVRPRVPRERDRSGRCPTLGLAARRGG